MYREKVGKKWYVTYMAKVNGELKKIREPKGGVDTDKECKDIQDTLELQARNNKLLTYGVADPITPVIDLWDNYLNSITVLGEHKELTIRGKRYQAKRELEYFTSLRDLNPTKMREWEAWLLKSKVEKGPDKGKNFRPETIAIRIRVWKTFMNWLVKKGYLSTSPMTGIKAPVGKFKGRALRLDELKVIFDVAPERLKPLLGIAMYTGARRGEIGKFNWNDVKETAWEIKDTKTGEDRIVDFPEQLASIVPKDTNDLNRYIKNSMYKDWKKAIAKSGIVGRVRLHDVRHSYATLYAERVGDLAALMSTLGWRDIETTQRYTHLTKKHVKNMQAKMNATLWGDLGATAPNGTENASSESNDTNSKKQ